MWKCATFRLLRRRAQSIIKKVTCLYVLKGREDALGTYNDKQTLRARVWKTSIQLQNRLKTRKIKYFFSFFFRSIRQLLESKFKEQRI